MGASNSDASLLVPRVMIPCGACPVSLAMDSVDHLPLGKQSNNVQVPFARCALSSLPAIKPHGFRVSTWDYPDRMRIRAGKLYWRCTPRNQKVLSSLCRLQALETVPLGQPFHHQKGQQLPCPCPRTATCTQIEIRTCECSAETSHAPRAAKLRSLPSFVPRLAQGHRV